MYHYTESGLPNVYLRGGYIARVIDGEEAVSIHDLNGLHKAIGQDIISRSPALTGDEVRFLRKEMDLTQNSFANIIGVSEDTVRNWENGRNGVGRPEDILIRGFYHETVNDDSGLRKIIENIARLNREIAEDERQMNFEETPDGLWQVAA
ncbi:hypothetical protein MNBD_GAMMA06-968 [hydrothermal vent metagenome]|uniref:HTH cro/C1-type domain-containing protein n=1 Tax=hydrothermal vent metagenome TaxID=652676 RepID=A0A3B0WEV0_9ZZZZ